MPTQGYIDLAAVRAALDFPDVLQHYGIDFAPGRTQLKISCPFHEDKTPSCGVNTEKKAFHCFGCGVKGNILEFVTLMEQENPETIDGLKAGALVAIELMGREASEFGKGGTPPQKPRTGRRGTRKPSDKEKGGSRPKTASAANSGPSGATSEPHPDQAGEITRNPPLDLQLSLETEHPFFETHGVSEAMVETFGLGFCNRGIMKGRICIPIHDEDGQLVAYAGRYASEEVPAGTERYKLPKRFLKSLVLYNLHRAIEIGGRHLVLVEGYWSAMRLHLDGVPVAAVMGISISEEQAALIAASGFRFVTVIFDGDEAGRTGLDNSLPILSRHVYARTLELGAGEKPDTMPEARVQALRPARKRSL